MSCAVLGCIFSRINGESFTDPKSEKFKYILKEKCNILYKFIKISVVSSRFQIFLENLNMNEDVS